MRFVTYVSAGQRGLAVRREDGGCLGLPETDGAHPGALGDVIAAGGDALERAHEILVRRGRELDLATVDILPPLVRPPKIICIGLNYAAHSAESGFEQPAYPTVFARFASSLVGHDAPVVRPAASEQLDFEGEFAAVIGVGGRHIDERRALDHVAGYSVFNDVSVRDFQFKSPQWTVGKNFDATGVFGPDFVTSDELPAGASGLRMETRLNGEVVQSASTDQMVFSVARLVAILSEAMTLEPGDVIVTGTPAGVGVGRKPPLWMKAGDVVEVEVEGLGLLRSPIVDQVTDVTQPRMQTTAA